MIPRSFPLTSAATALRSLTGVRRFAAALGFGGLMALAMPPFDLFPLVWLCLPSLIFLLQGTSNGKQAFLTGWSFAFGFFVFGLYWIAHAMFVDLARFWWAIPLAATGLPAFFALYYGLAAALARRMGLQGIRGALTFGGLWFLADWLRGHCFTGFPWNLLGYTWDGVLPVLQTTAFIGIYGLTFLTGLAASSTAALIDSQRASRVVFISGLALFGGLGLAGLVRLHTTPIGDVPSIRVRLVQPAISQIDKHNGTERYTHFQSLIALSAAPGPLPVTHVFWPETASPYYLAEEKEARRDMATHMPPSVRAIITGSIRRTVDPDGVTAFYNALVAIDPRGNLVASYDKAHLVPFGEFMPLRRYNPLPALAASATDFSRGDGVRSLRVKDLPPFSALICYEVIFSGVVADQTDRPGFLLNATNDGWYGHTTGPFQHFAIARVRAIEEGLPLLRVANTGISGIIDPLGRVRASLALDERGTLDGALPQSLPPTFFARYGEGRILSTLF